MLTKKRFSDLERECFDRSGEVWFGSCKADMELYKSSTDSKYDVYYLGKDECPEDDNYPYLVISRKDADKWCDFIKKYTGDFYKDFEYLGQRTLDLEEEKAFIESETREYQNILSDIKEYEYSYENVWDWAGDYPMFEHTLYTMTYVNNEKIA